LSAIQVCFEDLEGCRPSRLASRHIATLPKGWRARGAFVEPLLPSFFCGGQWAEAAVSPTIVTSTSTPVATAVHPVASAGQVRVILGGNLGRKRPAAAA
jgi:hypothetical protein